MVADIKNIVVAVLVDNDLRGTGYVASANTIITCAHVLTSGDIAKVGAVSVRFHRTGQVYPVTLSTAYWRDSSAEDIAVLVLDGPLPPGVEIATLASSYGRKNRTCEIFGYPKIGDFSGIGGRATIVEYIDKVDGSQLIQLDSAEATSGFSGSPLFDVNAQEVIGTIVEIATQSKARYASALYARLDQMVFATPMEVIANVASILNVNETKLENEFISSESLLTNCKRLVPAHIEEVAHEKYIERLYVRRGVEKEVNEYLDYEPWYKGRTSDICDLLNTALNTYDLPSGVAAAISSVKALAARGADAQATVLAIAELEEQCRVPILRQCLSLLNALLHEADNQSARVLAHNLTIALDSLPFISGQLSHKIRSEVATLRTAVIQFGKKDLERGGALAQRYEEFVELLPGADDDNHFKSVADLIGELRDLTERFDRRCLVLVGRAGRGKTNVMCRLAHDIACNHPVVLLSGQMDLENEYGIAQHVQSRLDMAVNGVFSDWMRRSSTDLQRNSRWFYVLIDGINETDQLNRMQRSIAMLLSQSRDCRVRLILSCRDVLWDFFRDKLTPHIFNKRATAVDDYSNEEEEIAIKSYCDEFEIRCTFGPDARRSLKNPLLLRFFCEASRNRVISVVENLRLVSTFDHYTERVAKEISSRLELTGSDAVYSLLHNIGAKLWETRSTELLLRSLNITPEEGVNTKSVYNQVLSANLIVEEVKASRSSDKVVRFVYDEYMEYIVARSWCELLTSGTDSTAERALLTDIIERLASFPPAFGAIVFLDQMLGREGALVAQMLSMLSGTAEEMLGARQTAVLAAFENASPFGADSALFSALVEFEAIAGCELKERLSHVIIKFLSACPNHPTMRHLAERILEITSKQPVVAESNVSRVIGKITRRLPSSSSGSTRRAQNASKKDPNLPSDDEKTPRLPPARFHYREKTRLNAIAILATAGNSETDALIDEGLRRMGRMELYDALEAIRAVDTSDDHFVFRMIGRYQLEGKPEYRICCAWLLRNRYGNVPAETLVALMQDSHTRVHQYVFQLFSSRLIEGPLLSRIVGLPLHKLKSWHVRHFIKLLGMRNRYIDQDARQFAPQVANTLSKLVDYKLTTIRRDVFYSLKQYEDCLPTSWLQERASDDADVWIRSLAG